MARLSPPVLETAHERRVHCLPVGAILARG